jgi:hypothetical protein
MKTFQSLIPALYQSGVYRSTVKSGAGVGFGLVFLLIIVGTLYLSIAAHFGLRSFLRDDAPHMAAQIPDIQVRNGRATTPEAKRYEVWSVDKSELIAIVDTRVDRAPQDLGGSLVFLAAKELTVMKNTLERRSYELAQVGTFTVDQPNLRRWMDLLGRWGAWVAFPIILIGMFFGRLFQWLAFSVVAVMALKLAHVPSGYAGALRLTSLAMVPSVLIDILLSCFEVTLPFGGLLFAGLIVAYIIFGSLSAREQTEAQS